MATVFVLQHVRAMGNDSEDAKFIGVYSSRQKAQEAVTRFANLPGFADTPDGFHIDEYRIDHDQWTEGFVTVTEASPCGKQEAEQDAAPDRRVVLSS